MSGRWPWGGDGPGSDELRALIIGVLVILALAAGFYLLLLGPLRAEHRERAEEREVLEARLAALDEEVEALEARRREAPEAERRLLELSRLVPGQPEVPTFLVQVQEVSEAAGVTALLVSPGTPEPPPGGGDFFRVPVTMTFEGTYDQLQDFLSRLRTLDRLVTVNEVSYQEAAGEETGLEEVEPTLLVELQTEIYFQPEDEPGGPQGEPGGAAPEAPDAPETPEGPAGGTEATEGTDGG